MSQGEGESLMHVSGRKRKSSSREKWRRGHRNGKMLSHICIFVVTENERDKVERHK